MKKIILYGHDGSANHGCEALVRTTAELLKNKSNEVMLISYRPEEDIRYGIDKLCQVKKRGDQANKLHKDIDFFRAYYQLKVKHDYGPMDDLAEAQATGGEPGDIAVAGFDNRDIAAYLQPPLTTVALPTTEIGVHAALHIIDMISNPRVHPAREIIKCSIVERASV